MAHDHTAHKQSCPDYKAGGLGPRVHAVHHYPAGFQSGVFKTATAAAF